MMASPLVVVLRSGSLLPIRQGLGVLSPWIAGCKSPIQCALGDGDGLVGRVEEAQRQLSFGDGDQSPSQDVDIVSVLGGNTPF